ncbi:hypothetical protein [Fulvimarina sp. MAC3]|uniref:hypothetical protein n=1 Tax=Fulvimarina sp. MAC3 TaxID=3148887 RepID=UPI0031FC03B9
MGILSKSNANERAHRAVSDDGSALERNSGEPTVRIPLQSFALSLLKPEKAYSARLR